MHKFRICTWWFFRSSPSAHLFSAACVYPLTHYDSRYVKEQFFFTLPNRKSSFQLSWKHKLIANLFWKSECKAYRKAFKTIALLIIRQLHLTWHIHWENYTLSVPAGTTLLSFVFTFYKNQLTLVLFHTKWNPMLFHGLTLCIGKRETKHLWEIKSKESTVKFYEDKKCD